MSSISAAVLLGAPRVLNLIFLFFFLVFHCFTLLLIILLEILIFHYIFLPAEVSIQKSMFLFPTPLGSIFWAIFIASSQSIITPIVILLILLRSFNPKSSSQCLHLFLLSSSNLMGLCIRYPDSKKSTLVSCKKMQNHCILQALVH
uniref:Uncharacterized protein n=1 Tax=Rhizophora mucronata TaxID=61149 RepID=A0A2P2J5A6_RHIMU